MIQFIKSLFSTPEPDWKKPIEIRYQPSTKVGSLGLMTIKTLDHNIKQYYHADDTHNPNSLWQWRRYPSHNLIKDQEIITSLDKHYATVLYTGIRTREGWVKSL